MAEEHPSIVGGDYMERPLWQFIRDCEVHIEEEAEKLAPDNALIALLCDAVRLARKMVRGGGNAIVHRAIDSAVERASNEA